MADPYILATPWQKVCLSSHSAAGKPPFLIRILSIHQTTRTRTRGVEDSCTDDLSAEPDQGGRGRPGLLLPVSEVVGALAAPGPLNLTSSPSVQGVPRL